MPAYGWLRTQILRCAGSIPANVAEGCGKATPKDFARFIDIAIGSARELENYLIQAFDLRFISGSEHVELTEKVDHVRRMLIRLSQVVRYHAERPVAAR